MYPRSQAVNFVDIENQVRASLPGIDDQYDIPKITAEIIDRFGLVDIDTVEASAYWDIVARHDHGIGWAHHVND
jgi:hypothetical protein